MLAGYPLLYPLSTSSRAHDLDMYASVTDPGGPAMTWGMYAVGSLELGRAEQAAQFLEMSYRPYTHKPFQVIKTAAAS